MKILVLCHAGCVRSVAMARTLKKRVVYGDVLNAGATANTSETINALRQWADVVVLMDGRLMKQYKDDPKAVLADVGPDVWGNPEHPDLVSRCVRIATRWRDLGWTFKSLSAKPKGRQ